MTRFQSKEDHNNEDITLLPETMFIDLIDVELQCKIANADNLDINAAEAVKSLLEGGPLDL